MSYIQYFIPADGDVEDHPNVYLVKKPQKDLRLADLQAAFPLPGQYFFRAKTTYGKTHGACVRDAAGVVHVARKSEGDKALTPSHLSAVWYDLNDPSDQVPIFNGRATLKVSRLSVVASTASAPAAAAPAATMRAPAPPPPAVAPLVGKSAASSSSSASNAGAAAASAAHHDLLGVFGSSSAAPSGPSSAPSSGAAAAGVAAADPFASSWSGGPRAGAGGGGGGHGGAAVDPFAPQAPVPRQGPAPAAKKPGGSGFDGLDIFS